MTTTLLKSFYISLISAMLIPLVQAANPASTNTTTGQGLEVVITAPAGPVLLDGSTINVHTNASLGGSPPVPVNIVYVTDLSESMHLLVPSNIGDCNGDSRPNTRLDAACFGLIALNQAMGAASTVDIGLVGFAHNARNADMDPASGLQLFTTPANVDNNSNTIPDVEEVISSLRYYSSPGSNYAIGKFTPIPKAAIGTYTNFQDALTKMQDAFNTQPAGEVNIAAFISDGQQTAGNYMIILPSVIAAGTTVHTFAVGPTATTECQLNKPLGIIANDTGGSCTVVIDPSTLESVLPEVLTTRIQSLDLNVNGSLVASMSGSESLNMSLSNVDVNAYLVDGSNLVTSTAVTEDGTSVTADVTLEAYSTINVQIDIKPGSFPNSINRNAKGVMAVAVFGSNDFDVSTILAESVMLTGASIAERKNGTLMVAYDDVNGDGFTDMVVHFRTQDLELDASDTSAILSGETSDGFIIEGSDSVRIVK